MKVGLDVHGVIEEHPVFFRNFCAALVKGGAEVHIITGKERHKVTEELESHGLICGEHYTHFFSITDHHKELGTPIRWDKKGNPWMDPLLWIRTKGEYCQKVGIDLHLDDTDSYGLCFTTPFARYFSKNKRPHYIPEFDDEG